MPTKSARAYADLGPEGGKYRHRWGFVYLDGGAEDAMQEHMEANGLWGAPDIFGADKRKPGVGVHDVTVLGKDATAFIWTERNGMPGGLIVLDADRSAKSRAQAEFNKHLGHNTRSIMAGSMDKTTKRIMDAWKDAQGRMKAGENFYEALADELRDSIGVRWTEDDIKGWFADWNRLDHEEATAIAEEHGTDVRKGGFQAYLAHQTHSGGRMAADKTSASPRPRALAAKWLGQPVDRYVEYYKEARGPKLPPEIDSIVRSAVQDAIENVGDSYEDHAPRLIEPGGRGFKFGSGSDGGYGGQAMTNLSYISGTGGWPNDSKLRGALEQAEAKSYEYAKNGWLRVNKDAIVEAGVASGEMNYSDLYDLGLDDLAEELSEAESEAQSNEDAFLRLGAFYYGPENSREGRKGEQTMYVFAVVDFDGHFLPSGMMSLFETSFSFANPRDLASKLRSALNKAAQSLM